MRRMKFSGIRAFVSGGASGLGRAVAAGVLGAGGSAVLLDVNPTQGAATAAELGPRAHFFCGDVTSESSIESASAFARERLGGLELAVSCAGIGTAGRLIGRTGPMSAEFFRRMIEINLVGTLLCSKAAALLMQQNEPNAEGERGVIVMTASIAAYDGQIGQVAYSASKGGIVGMTLPMARELASSGIRVVTIAPGIFQTPLLAALPEAAQVSLGQQVPFPPRLGRPDEYAALVAQIVENSMLNGETIRLDGALRMAPR
ncbi:MAG TPA: SDR family NAD(P)-dependent oxidoreductase [Steroidobacteraceae bacterium]|jgi:NAD(P)-dependent dehydrogenase (short-subunit alcohol dehydrogenase family)|nr:SDR family NAD(P)-dependent oxidoreductase [Steroidobacteraceae bacterium]